jgi:hypothetical protein
VEVVVFGRLGSWCFRRRRIVLLAWIVGIVLVASVSHAVGGNFGQDVNPPGFESTRGLDTLKAEFGGTGAGLQGTLVYRADQGLQDPQVKAGIQAQLAMIEKIAADPKVDVLHDPTFASLSPSARRAVAGDDLTQMKGMTVDDPYDTGGEPRIATTGPTGTTRGTSAAPSRTCSRPSTACAPRSAARPSASSKSRPPRRWASPSPW